MDESKHTLRQHKVKKIKKKLKVKANVDDVSAEEIKDVVDKHIEKHPNDGQHTGIFKHVENLKKELQEKEKEQDEEKNYRNYVAMINFINENEIKEIVQCIDMLKNEIDENEKEKRKLNNDQNCIVMTNCTNVNEIKFQRKFRHKGVQKLKSKEK